MMAKRVHWFAWMGILMFVISDNFAYSQQNKSDPSLEILNYYIGSWDVKFTSDNAPNRAVSEAKWILNHSYVEQNSIIYDQNDVPIFRIKTLITYDSKSNRYKYWIHNSNRETLTGEGTWNSATNTMTSTFPESKSGNSTVIVANFSESGKESWSITGVNAQGSSTYTISGVNTKRTSNND